MKMKTEKAKDNKTHFMLIEIGAPNHAQSVTVLMLSKILLKKNAITTRLGINNHLFTKGTESSKEIFLLWNALLYVQMHYT